MKQTILIFLIIPILLSGQDFLDPKEPLMFEFKNPSSGVLITDRWIARIQP